MVQHSVLRPVMVWNVPVVCLCSCIQEIVCLYFPTNLEIKPFVFVLQKKAYISNAPLVLQLLRPYAMCNFKIKEIMLMNQVSIKIRSLLIRFSILEK